MELDPINSLRKSMSISLLDVANHYGDLSHQNDALQWLTVQMNDSKLYPKLGWEFARQYRNNQDGSTINLVNVMRYYEELDYQANALIFLQDNLKLDTLKEFADLWRKKPSIIIPTQINLDLPWYPQTDSTTSHANRMCFSSSVSMCASYQSKAFRNKFTGTNADDQYLNYLHSNFGDTTDPNAQVRCLKSLGLNATFRTDLSLAEAINLLKNGIPLTIGFLHRGSEYSPSGGGHYAALKGFNSDQNMFYLNDPFGSLHDGYRGSVENGFNVSYSRATLNNRWTVETPGKDSKCGWGLYILP